MTCEKIALDWEGDTDVLRKRVTNFPSLESARSRLAIIRAMRRDLQVEFFQCLELHIRILFESDDATVYLTDAKKDSKNFLYHLANYLSKEYYLNGIPSVAKFIPVTSKFSSDELMDVFLKVIKNNSTKTCDSLMALLTLRIEKFNEIAPKLVENMRNHSMPSSKIEDFTQFCIHRCMGTLDTQQCITVFDTFFDNLVKQHGQDPSNSVVDNSAEVQKAMDDQLINIMTSTYPFVHAFAKIKLPHNFLRVEVNTGDFFKKAIAHLTTKWGAVESRIMNYVLFLFRFRLPSIWQDDIFYPVLQDGSVNSTEFIYGKPLKELGKLCAKFDPKSVEFRNAMKTAEASHLEKWIVLALFYSGSYQAAIDYCNFSIEQSGLKEEDCPMESCVKFVSFIQLKQLQQGFQLAMKMWNLARDKGYQSIGEYLEGWESETEIIIPGKLIHLQQFVAMALQSMFHINDNLSHILEVSRIVLCQVNFEYSGCGHIKPDCKRIQDNFNVDDLLKYVKHPGVFWWIMMARPFIAEKSEAQKFIDASGTIGFTKCTEKDIWESCNAFLQDHQEEITKQLGVTDKY